MPSIAGDLGPADLIQEQMSAAFPVVGTVWEAWCGQMPSQEKCTVTLEENELIVNDNYKIPYENLIKSEHFDSMWSITRLGKADPVYAQWEGYLKRSGMAHTVLVQYLSSENKPQLLIGLGVASIALAGSYWLIKRSTSTDSNSKLEGVNSPTNTEQAIPSLDSDRSSLNDDDDGLVSTTDHPR